ncbi:hypothetical protein BC835DRAFT_1408984 [Cytidiella melzeri]|nr:hypothetical protein BC835DRAFT_1408984 [Cytidiella melzeri]
MRQCGTPNVPSFSALRAVQARLKSTIGPTSARHVSTLGNEFHMNSAPKLFSLDFANPLVRPHIRPYIEISPSLSEFYQAERLQNENVDLLQLMWADFNRSPHRHFYIKELAQTDDGTFVIPMRWVRLVGAHGNEVDCADVHEVDYDETTRKAVIRVNDTLTRLEASRLKSTYLDLVSEGYSFVFEQDAPEWCAVMPHPIRTLAQGRPTFTISIMSWKDDVSGNRSKQYNAHTNNYLANLNLPHAFLQQEYNIRFSATSPHASALELADGLSQDIGADQWHEGYDCALQQEILFRIINRIEPADNPQQSELCSHIECKEATFAGAVRLEGHSRTLRARKDIGNYFGVPETVAEITAQLVAATHGVAKTVETMQTKSGIKDAIAQHWIDKLIAQSRLMHEERMTNPLTQDPRFKDRRLIGPARQAVRKQELMRWLTEQPTHRYRNIPVDSEKRSQIRAGDHFNVLLTLDGLDVHRDTLVEILHTWGLGQGKYAWHKSTTTWNEQQLACLAIRLQASSVDGLSTSTFPIRGPYFVKYRNALVGKHFKAIQQVIVFHLYTELGNPLLLALWRATGEVGALLHYSRIDDLESYLADLEILIDNVLDIWAELDPLRIIEKGKLHVLTHLIQDIRNAGPAVIYSTEIFECWNAIFRTCSILSNHQAPSHDIAEALGELECFKHLISGGWWRTNAGKYVQAGEGVRNMFLTYPDIQRRLGWVDRRVLIPGSVKQKSCKKRTSARWSSIHQAEHLKIDMLEPGNLSSTSESENEWEYGSHVISQAHDICREGSWVFYNLESNDDQTHTSHVGRIRRVLISNSSTTLTFILIDEFNILEQLDERTRMPVLVRESAQMCHFVKPAHVKFIFNAQHNCLLAECNIKDSGFVQQERQDTTLSRKVVVHEARDCYLLNLHGLHNASLIRQALPRHLTKPVPYFQDRANKHREFAAAARQLLITKRSDAAAKAKATRARNLKAAPNKLQPQAAGVLDATSPLDNP